MKKMLLMVALGFATAGVVLVPATPVHAAEHVALDVTREYHTGLFGFSDDETFTIAGRITRVDVSYEFQGPASGGAYEVLPRRPGQVKVHRYLDLFSKLKIHITVYAE